MTYSQHTAVMHAPIGRQSQRSRVLNRASPTEPTHPRWPEPGAEAFHGFSTEQQLVSAFWKLFGQAASASRTWKWLREFNSPCGIADIVAVSLSRDWQRQISIAHIPARWLYPLKSLSLEQEFDAKKFALDFGVSESCAQNVLSAYVGAGYCVYRAAQRSWIKVQEPLPIVDRIVAVEAKLRDWRRALYQAVQYAAYSSEAWVVLDRRCLPSASLHIDEFEKRGVGLMGLSATGDSEIVAKPTHRPPRNHGRFWQANAEIAKRLLQERAVVSS